MKKILSILLVLIMCIGAMPMSASAVTTVDVKANSSYYTFDSSTNTLTLKDGFNANQTPSVYGEYSPQIYSNGNLNIVVNGTCYIMMQSASYSAKYAAGILCVGNLHISGTGTLNICYGGVTFPNHFAAGIVALRSLNEGLNGSKGNVTVGEGVNVNITLGTAKNSYGMIGNLYLNDANLSIKTDNTQNGSFGIKSSRFFVNSSSSVLTIEGNDTQSGSSYAYDGTFNYNGGNITLTAQKAISSGAENLNHSAKIYCNTSPTPSTTLWNDGRSWSNYKYIKIVDDGVAVTGVSLNKSSLSLAVGSMEKLTATIAPSNATDKVVSWSSSDDAVATVSRYGEVIARAVGTATITVKTQHNSKTATCTVTVTPAGVSVTGVSLNMSSLSLNVGGTSNLTATVSPSNATNKNVTWSSSNTSVATVSSTGVVTARAVGTATITVKTADGNKTATCTVKVVEFINSVAITNLKLPKAGDKVNWNYNITANVGTTDLFWIESDRETHGESDLMDAVFEGYGYDYGTDFTFKEGKYYILYGYLKCTNPNMKLADDLTMTVNGQAIISNGDYFEASYYVGSSAVSVTGVSLNKSSLSLIVGNVATLTATVAPSNATNKAVTWTSSNTAVATVSTTGDVTARGAGTATITVKTADGNKTATCTVAVNAPTKSLSSISVTSQPTKKVYTAGESFDKSGMVVKANYSDSTSVAITNYTVTNGNNLTAGTTSVIISYTEDGITKTTTVPITVNAPAKSLSSISVTSQPTKKVYTAGESFDKSGLVVKANYSDSTSVAITNYTVTNGNNLTAGTTSVTISYTEDGITKTTTVPITVNAVTATLIGIEIVSVPSATEIKYKSSAPTDGLKVIAKYSNGTTKDVTDQVTIKNFSATNKRGNYTATVEFEGMSATFNYNVKYSFGQWLIIIFLFGWIWY